MQFRIENQIFKEYIKFLDSTSPENIIEINNEGFLARFTNNINVSMINSILKKEAFEYYPDINEKTYIAFNFKRILNILNQIDNKENVDIFIKDNKLKILSNDLEYSESCLDISLYQKPEQIELPININFKTKLLLNSHFLKEKIRAISYISDYIIFQSDKENEEFRILNGCENDTISLIFKANKNNYLIHIIELEDSKSCYDLQNYLKNFISVIPDYHEMEINLGNNQPLLIKYKNDYKTLLVDYYLAPRIEL